MSGKDWTQIALDLMPDGIAYVQNGRIEYANPALLDILNCKRRDVEGRLLDVIIIPEDLTVVAQIMDSILAGAPGYPSRVRLLGAGGIPMDVGFTPHLLQDAKEDRRWMCVFRDRNKEILAGDGLSREDEKYRALVENAPEAILIYDVHHGRFVDANEKAIWLFGLERRAILKVGLVELSAVGGSAVNLHLDDLQLQIGRAADGEAVEFEWLCKGAAGNEIPCEVRMAPLPSAGKNLIRCSFIDITDRKLVEDDLIQEALFDTLTGLANRNLFFDRLDATIRRSLSDAAFEYAVIFFDLDRFKNVNDSLGHMVGDKLLHAIASRLEGVIGEHDLAARIAGDEFTILLEDYADPSYPELVAEKLLAALMEPFDFSGQEVRVSASIGITRGSIGYNKPENILRDADTAMYSAKSKGKARYEFFDPEIHPRAVDLLQLENELRRALERNEFCLFYEPIVSIESREITGLEVFIRWQHPERGLLFPVDFIKHAEEVGLIANIDSWVLKNACRQYIAWNEMFPSPGRLAVNLSTHYIFRQNSLVSILDALKTAAMPASTLELELLESVLINDVDFVVEAMRAMKALGLRLSLDDFGAVYSSLNQLRRLPVDNLRIDRTLVRDIEHDEASRAIVTSIISLAHELGIDVIAEGVESEKQLAMLAGWGCDEAQGFLFGPSRPADRVADLLESGVPISTKP